MALTLNPGASEEALRAVAEWIGSELPFDYKEFLRNSNGGEGSVGQNYLQLWAAEDLRERNEGYQVPEFAPGLLLIASDGGGEAYGFDTRRRPWKVVKVPFMDIGDPVYTTEWAGSFTSFLLKIGR